MSSLGMRAVRGLARAAAPRTSAVFASTARAGQFRSIVARSSFAKVPASSFSTALRFQNVTNDLVSKLQSEIDFETEASTESANTPYDEHFRNLSFEVQDVAGKEEVVLTREYNGEQIKITFSVSDIHNADAANHMAEEADQPLYDEAHEGKQQSGADAESSAAHTADAAEDLENVSFACRVNIQITKPNTEGVLHINAVAEDGEFLIDTMPFYTTADAATTSPAAVEEDTQYIGPPFSNLDEDLQVLVTQYLEERGVNTDLALLIPEYIDWKEQNEYIQWLKNIKQFLQN